MVREMRRRGGRSLVGLGKIRGVGWEEGVEEWR